MNDLLRNDRATRRPGAARRWFAVGAALLAVTALLVVGLTSAGRSGLGAILRRSPGARGLGADEIVRRFDVQLRGRLARAGADTTLIRRDVAVSPAEGDRPERRRFRWEVPVPRTFELAAGESLFVSVVRQAGGEPGGPIRPRGGRQLVMASLRPDVGVELLLMGPEPETTDRPRLAILVDSFGHRNLAESEAMLEFGRGLTVAIPPNATGARDLADRCREKGMEVVVSLPMEDYDYPRGDPGPGGILVDMSERQVRDRVSDAFDRLGGAEGAHTLMGSLAVEDKLIMRTILDEVRKRHGYFLESTRSTYSTVPALAGELGVPATRLRNNIDAGGGTAAAVSVKLEELAALARRRGWAIGLVHPQPGTVQALKRLLPLWAGQGLEVVPVSEVVTVPGGESGRRND